uniref:Uncharacterized protein n=1 Tax=Rhizophora mucronata TaxID=61149 RepID=A0A2P2N1X1_RHIMU
MLFCIYLSPPSSMHTFSSMLFACCNQQHFPFLI